MYAMGNKRIRRICIWIVSVLTIVLLINGIGISVLATETEETHSCICDVRCNADSVNEDCPVCMANYEECNAEEEEEAPAPEESPGQNEGDTPETPGQNEGDTPETPGQNEGGTPETPGQNEGDLPEMPGQGCICDELCDADNVNENCPVCIENYEECNPAEQATEEVPGQQGTFVPGPGTGSSMSGARPAAGDASSDDPTVVVSRTADVVFVIDATGSMGNYIQKVKDRISDFIRLLDETVNVRVRFVVYYDMSYTGQYTVLSDWYSEGQIEDAIAYLGNISVSGGGDEKETALDGMGQLFQDDFGWRESVAKFSILLTDAPYKENNSFGYTFGDITDKLIENDITSSLIVPSSTTVYDDWMVNDGQKGNISGDYSFLLDWIEDVILPKVDEMFQNVSIEVKIDNILWEEHGKDFILKNIDKGFYVKDFSAVENGNYQLYEVAAPDEYLDTGITITVNGDDEGATVDYYTVTFHDGGTVLDENGRIVLKGTKVVEPSTDLTKEGYIFYGWRLYDASDEEKFSFETPIEEKTDLYAIWLAIEEETFTISVSVGQGGSVSPDGEVVVKSGASQQFVITPDDGYQIDTVLVDGEPVQLENAWFLYSTLSERAGTEMSADNTNAKQYTFENVTSDHTLSATFKVLPIQSVNELTESTHDDSPVVVNDTPVTPQSDIVTGIPVSASNDSEPEVGGASNDSEPKTGDVSHAEVYGSIGMISGLLYLLFCFVDRESGMTEEEKKEIIGALMQWAGKGKWFRKYVALAIVFVILVYYHSVGKMHGREMERIMCIK